MGQGIISKKGKLEVSCYGPNLAFLRDFANHFCRKHYSDASSPSSSVDVLHTHWVFEQERSLQVTEKYFLSNLSY